MTHNATTKSIFLKRFNMIKLKAKVNKSEIIRRLKIEADKRFKDSWQPELQSESFMKGVEELFKQLRLDDVIKCEGAWHNESIKRYGSCGVCKGIKKN